MNDQDATDIPDLAPLVEHIMGLPPAEHAEVLAMLWNFGASTRARERREYELAARHLREVFRDPVAEQDSMPGEVSAWRPTLVSNRREGWDEPCA